MKLLENGSRWMLIAALIPAGLSQAQIQLHGVAEPVAPQSKQECSAMQAQWSENEKKLNSARDACERKDGGTIFAAGIWMPNCKSRQQAYITCTSISDQICSVRNRMAAAYEKCVAKVDAYLDAERARKLSLDRIQQDLKIAAKVGNTAAEIAKNGPVSFIANRTSDAVKEAARTGGTSAPDSQRLLNEVGKATNDAMNSVPRNRVVAEIADQSMAASRARMGDALDQLNESFRAYGNTSVTGATALNGVSERGDSDDEEDAVDARQSNGAERLRQLRMANQAMQDIVRRSSSAYPSNQYYQPPVKRAPRPQRLPFCNYELVGPGPKPPCIKR